MTIFDKSEELIRSDIGIMFCLLEDILQDEDLNKSRRELQSLVKRLAYLTLDEG